MATSFIHPRLFNTLKAFFPTSGSIQACTESRDAAGQPIKTWSNKTGLTSLTARVQPTGGGEAKGQTGIIVRSQFSILLSGSYTGITEKDRFTDGTNNYDIVGVDLDGNTSLTRLAAEIVE